MATTSQGKYNLLALRLASQIKSTPLSWFADESLSPKPWPLDLSVAKQAVDQDFKAAASSLNRTLSTKSDLSSQLATPERSPLAENVPQPARKSCPALKKGLHMPLLEIPPSPSSPKKNLRSEQCTPQSSPFPKVLASPLSLSSPNVDTFSKVEAGAVRTNENGNGGSVRRNKRKQESVQNGTTPKRKMTHLVGHVDVSPSANSVQRPSMPGFMDSLNELKSFLDPEVISGHAEAGSVSPSPKVTPVVPRAAESKNLDRSTSSEDCQVAEGRLQEETSESAVVANVQGTPVLLDIADWMKEDQYTKFTAKKNVTSPHSSSTAENCVEKDMCQSGNCSPVSVLDPWNLEQDFELPAFESTTWRKEELSTFATSAHGLRMSDAAATWATPCEPDSCHPVGGHVAPATEQAQVGITLEDVMEHLRHELAPSQADEILLSGGYSSSDISGEDTISAGAEDFGQVDADEFTGFLPTCQVSEVDGMQWLADPLFSYVSEASSPLRCLQLDFDPDLTL